MKVSVLRRTYEPIGRCIYCLRTAEGANSHLTREHIIPISLGGGLVIGKASCSDCQGATHAFEGQIAGKMLVNARRLLGLPRNRKRRNKPWPKTVIFLNEGGEMVPVEIPFNKHPPVIMIPSMGPSTFSQGLPPSDRVPITAVWSYFFPGFEDSRNKLPRNASFAMPFNPTYVCQLMAKIAHGYAVGELGLDRFESFVTDLIRFGTPNPFHYVGGTDDKLIPHEKHLHSIDLNVGDQDRIVRVRIRLFSLFGGPTYEVYVGKAT